MSTLAIRAQSCVVPRLVTACERAVCNMPTINVKLFQHTGNWRCIPSRIVPSLDLATFSPHILARCNPDFGASSPGVSTESSLVLEFQASLTSCRGRRPPTRSTRQRLPLRKHSVFLQAMLWRYGAGRNIVMERATSMSSITCLCQWRYDQDELSSCSIHKANRALLEHDQDDEENNVDNKATNRSAKRLA